MSRLRASDQIGLYTIIRKLGEGGMGCVYLAKCGKRQLAIKVFDPKVVRDTDMKHRMRFRNEIRLTKKANSLFTPEFIDSSMQGETPWLALEYVPGITLAHAIRLSRFSKRQLLILALAISSALEDIHGAGIVHCDLKPGNIIIGPHGIKVIDFGIAKDALSPEIPGSMLGTPPYIAPEQIFGASVSPKTDIFALGSLLTVAATGIYPFGKGQAALKAIPKSKPRLTGVPGDIREYLIKPCLQKDPLKRPSAADITAICRSAKIQIPQDTSWLPPEVQREIYSATKPAKPKKTKNALHRQRALEAVALIGILLFLLNSCMSSCGERHIGAPASKPSVAATKIAAP